MSSIKKRVSIVRTEENSTAIVYSMYEKNDDYRLEKKRRSQMR